MSEKDRKRHFLWEISPFHQRSFRSGLTALSDLSRSRKPVFPCYPLSRRLSFSYRLISRSCAYCAANPDGLSARAFCCHRSRSGYLSGDVFHFLAIDLEGIDVARWLGFPIFLTLALGRSNIIKSSLTA